RKRRRHGDALSFSIHTNSLNANSASGLAHHRSTPAGVLHTDAFTEAGEGGRELADLVQVNVLGPGHHQAALVLRHSLEAAPAHMSRAGGQRLRRPFEKVFQDVRFTHVAAGVAQPVEDAAVGDLLPARLGRTHLLVEEGPAFALARLDPPAGMLA